VFCAAPHTARISFCKQLLQNMLLFMTSGSQPMGCDPKLGHGEHPDGSRIFYKSHFIFYFRRTLTNVKACGKENNIQISLHMKSLSCSNFTSYLNLHCGVKIPVHTISLYNHSLCQMTQFGKEFKIWHMIFYHK
jgi:hypothetical protein